MTMGQKARLGGLVVISALALTGCTTVTAATTKKPAAFTVEKAEGSSLARLRLQPTVVDRIGIQTSVVSAAPGVAGGTGPTVVDYAALVYEPKGATSVYTNPSPFVFVRQSVKVDRIEGDVVVLADGPPVGTTVVTVGTAQLLGMEFGVGK